MYTENRSALSAQGGERPKWRNGKQVGYRRFQGGIDLHAHTTASDGDRSPTELVQLAKELGLEAIAITDHDTVEGVEEALKAGQKYGIEVVPGIEISAVVDKGQCHLLGYFVDPTNSQLRERLGVLRAARDARNRALVERLNQMGIPITLQAVAQEAQGELLARPHFAKVMVKLGVVSNVQEAFDRYLADGVLPGISKEKLPPEEAIALIHQAGGVAVLAHPNNLKRSPEAIEERIREYQAMGLDGIEARYNAHTPEDTARYLALAERLGLLTTGGSDFHGYSVKPQVHLGHVEGDRPAPYALLEPLRFRAKHRKTSH